MKDSHTVKLGTFFFLRFVLFPSKKRVKWSRPNPPLVILDSKKYIDYPKKQLSIRRKVPTTHIKSPMYFVAPRVRKLFGTSKRSCYIRNLMKLLY